MPVLTTSAAQRLDDEAATLSIREIAAYLQEAVGQRVAAAMAGCLTQTDRPLRVQGGLEPHGATERRLRTGYKVVRMLVDAYDDKTARAWLFGTNTRLDDRARSRCSAPRSTRGVRVRSYGPHGRSPASSRDPTPKGDHSLWRVGYLADPLGFTPLELFESSNRFDDIHRRFRTLYLRLTRGTFPREVLADFRPNLGALRPHVERDGPEAAPDFTGSR